MNHQMKHVLDRIAKTFHGKIQKGSRHYLEVSIGGQADELGYAGLKKKYKNTYAIVPLKLPQGGMKVRIDGRTFVNYAEHESGIAVPGFLARGATPPLKPFVARDSMVCNFTRS